MHRSYADDKTLSGKNEREIFRIAFENIRNSKSLQEDIIEKVDQSRMKELYESSKKQLERQQRMESTVKKRSKSNAAEIKRKKAVKISSKVEEIAPLLTHDTVVELPPAPIAEKTEKDKAPQESSVEDKKSAEETPSFMQKVSSILDSIWQTILSYLIMLIDLFIRSCQPFINVAYGNESDIIELLTGSITVSDQRSLIENREYEEKFFNEILKDGVEAPMLTKKPESDNDDVTSKTNEGLNNEKQSNRQTIHNLSLLFKKLEELQVTLTHLYLSNTDTLVYLAMIVNAIYSPTIYNLLFTFSAFIYAAIQYPFPPRYYWLSILGASQALIAFEYILYLVQKGFVSSAYLTKYKYESLEILGWKPHTFLIQDIVMYLIVIFAVLQHRDTLKKRGDWYYKERAKKEHKKQNREKALKKANEQNNRESTTISLSTSNNVESSQISHSRLSNVGRPKSLSTSAINPPPTDLDGNLEPAIQPEPEKPNIVIKVYMNAVAYFKRVTDSNAKLGKDYFTVTIAIQLLSLLFFFVAYPYMTGRITNDITGAIQSNQLSSSFVVILFLFFVEICVERVIYLYAKLWVKLLYQCFLVIVYHIVFIVMNDFMLKSGNDRGSKLLKVLFVLKCIYLYISCVQLKNGYPTTGIYSSFFTKNYFWVHYYVYLGWRAIPFVFELKTLLDWTFINTTLNFFEWMKMEDVYSELYSRKCDLEYRKILGRKYGQGQYWTRKLFAGFFIFVAICFLLFFPLGFYSNVNPDFTYNAVSLVRSNVGVTGFQSFYENQFYVSRPDLIPFTNLFNNYSREPAFSQFDPGSFVQSFNLPNWSEVYWIISKPSKNNLGHILSTENNVSLTLRYSIERAGPVGATTLQGTQEMPLTIAQRDRLAAMIESKTGGYLDLEHAYNPFLLNNYDTLDVVTRADKKYWPSCTIGLRKEITDSFFYWMMNCTKFKFNNHDSQNATMLGPSFIIQSTMIVTNNNFSLTRFISGFGIIAFYTTFVLAVGQFIRLSVTGLVSRIYFTDVDNVDLLLSFVKDIYIARENGALDLEETMYVQLMRIFRDTSLLQVWTNINRSTL